MSQHRKCINKITGSTNPLVTVIILELALMANEYEIKIKQTKLP